MDFVGYICIFLWILLFSLTTWVTCACENTKVSRWYAEYHCSGCNKVLKKEEVFKLGGVCPFCGNVTCNSLIKHYVMVRRDVYSRKYIFFWNKTHQETKGRMTNR